MKLQQWSIHLFPILGIRLEVHLTFFALIALFGITGWEQAGWSGLFWSILFIVVIFACVVLHELGHSLAARHYGIEVSRILLLPFGGMAQFGSLPREPRTELVITAAGPAVNFILFGFLFLSLNDPFAFFRSAGIPQSPLGLLESVLAINLVMGVFNLLPIFPMDGGRLLRAVLATRLPYLQATRWAVLLAKVLSVAGIFIALVYWQNILLALLFTFIFLGGEWEYRAVKAEGFREKFRGVQVGDVMRRNFLTIRSDQTVRDAIRFLHHHRPQDMVVMEEEEIRGILTRAMLEDCLRHHQADQTTGELKLRPASLLQIDWPLELISDRLFSEGIFALVYDGGELVGVLDPEELEEAIFWHDLRRNLPPPLPHSARF